VGFGNRSGYLGHIKLAPGVTVTQAVVLVIVGVIGNLVTLLIPIMQPYILQNQLHLDTAIYGRVAGDLALVQNAVMLLFVTLLGAFGDRFGRKLLMYGSMAAMGIGCLLYPFITSLAVAVLLNFIVGLGLASFYAAVGASVFAYPDNASRGQFVSALIITQTITTSIMIGFVGTHLPKWLTGMGYSQQVAGGAVFWLLASTCVVGFYATSIGFERKGSSPKSPGKFDVAAEIRGLFALLGEVLRYAKLHPRFGMLLLMSCAFRADLVVVMTFLSVWVVSAARVVGIDSADALRVIGSLLILFQISNLVGTLVSGYFADRVDRHGLLMFALAMGGTMFLSPLLVRDILSWQIYAVVSLVGLSEGVSAIATQSLLGQETPAHLRGSVTGAFTVIGMLGAMIVNFAGGQLFDKVSYVGPFLMVAAMNLVCLFACLLPGKQSFRHSASS
jgi:MFS family permease